VRRVSGEAEGKDSMSGKPADRGVSRGQSGSYRRESAARYHDTMNESSKDHRERDVYDGGRAKRRKEVDGEEEVVRSVKTQSLASNSAISARYVIFEREDVLFERGIRV